MNTGPYRTRTSAASVTAVPEGTLSTARAVGEIAVAFYQSTSGRRRRRSRHFFVIWLDRGLNPMAPPRFRSYNVANPLLSNKLSPPNPPTGRHCRAVEPAVHAVSRGLLGLSGLAYLSVPILDSSNQ